MSIADIAIKKGAAWREVAMPPDSKMRRFGRARAPCRE